jgi:NAD+ synthase (glutamine-hydrolysing)
MVYRLAHYINRNEEIIPERVLTKPPSAELRPDQTDQDSLPPYDVLDTILSEYVEKDQNIGAIAAKGYDRATVIDVVRRIHLNEYKRKQAPLGLKITTKAFGSGRRYPIAHRINLQ